MSERILSEVRFIVRWICTLPFCYFSLLSLVGYLAGEPRRALSLLLLRGNRVPLTFGVVRFVMHVCAEVNNFHLAERITYRWLLRSYARNSNVLCSAYVRFYYRRLAATLVSCFFLTSKDKRDFTYLINTPYAAEDMALSIPYCGRLSNFLIQLSNAVLIASKLGIKSVYVSGKTPEGFPSIETLGWPVCVHSVRVSFEKPRSRLVISSFFFHVRRAVPVFFTDSPSIRDVLRCLPKFAPTNSFNPGEVGSALTIHIRSGDIFSGTNVHPDYGQPPLAFYQLVIELAQPETIVLVYEDRANPVIPALEKWLVSTKRIFRASHGPLKDALIELAKAEQLVISRGTFALAPLVFSRSLRQILCFCASLETDPYMRFAVDEFRKTFVNSSERKITEVIDQRGLYFQEVCSHNWRNTERQRTMMLRYSGDNFVVLK